MTLDELRTQVTTALTAFARGDPQPVKRLYSRADDVTLANPFGPAVRGWADVSAALDFASSRFRDGHVSGIDSIASYTTSDLATSLDLEHWRSRVGDGELAEFDLRVTTTYRREADGWKIVHRHADPISTPNPDGPLRDR